MKKPFVSCLVACTRLVVLGLLFSSHLRAAPVEFLFELPGNKGNPYARELWAEVTTPSGRVVELPVFFHGSDQFAVRARPDETGEYRLGRITEIEGGSRTVLTPRVAGSDRKKILEPVKRAPVQLAADRPDHFVFSTGEIYTPIGANLAWADHGRFNFYRKAITEFSKKRLNWMRVWMVHWSGLNLEWLPENMGKSPPPGVYDLRVAEDWDRMVELAEAKGVYLQVVLQHHGQYTTGANSNWKDNPLNAVNPGGILQTPSEFFTSPLARGLTAMKYRYIVARWGYSSAIMAWEFFNEVHWTDTIDQERNFEAVGAWHTEMAGCLRAVDVYHHMVTTSTDDLGNAAYAAMDFYQPHLYSPAMLTAVRQVHLPSHATRRPVFYGEVGDDHMEIADKVKRSGVAIVPLVWASLMGESDCPAQTWHGHDLLKTGRVDELAAVQNFLEATKLMERTGLKPFSAAMECPVRTPLILKPGQFWQRRPAARIVFPLDGRDEAELADMPQILVGSQKSVDDGFSRQVTVALDAPREMKAILRVADAGNDGAAIKIHVDGCLAVERIWPKLEPQPGKKTKPRPENLAFTLAPGPHEIVVENTGEQDWVKLAGLELDADMPMVAAVGKRSDDCIAAWIWHREGVFAKKAPKAISGTIVIEEVPVGAWQVVWWDTLKGRPEKSMTIKHAGGQLKLVTPPVSRHLAVILTKQS